MFKKHYIHFLVPQALTSICSEHGKECSLFIIHICYYMSDLGRDSPYCLGLAVTAHLTKSVYFLFSLKYSSGLTLVLERHTEVPQHLKEKF